MDRKFWFTVTLSLATVWFLQIYWGRNTPQQGQTNGPVSVVQQQQQNIIPNQPVKVSSVQDFYRPLNVNVAFDDIKNSETVETSVETPHYKALFSNQGAILTSLEYKEHLSKSGAFLNSIKSHGIATDEQRQKGFFLLALDDKTPFAYHVVGRREVNSGKPQATTEISYQAETEQWLVGKIYTLHHDSYQIDLTIRIEPKGGNVKQTRVRVFYQAPFVEEVAEDTVNLFSLDKAKNAIERHDLDKAEGLAWPWDVDNVMFGADDKYFVHAIIKDPNLFVQRSYFKQVNVSLQPNNAEVKKEVYSVLESPAFGEKKEWTLSFYTGPKVIDHLQVVDARLVDVMSFGWLSWLCLLLLKLLALLFGFLGNYGWAIVALGVVLRIPLIPLSIYSRKKMEIYQKFQPTIQKIRMKYRHDVKMQHEELMKFHQDHHLSTATPILGCLPMLIQMPVLFALFRMLNNYLDLYQAPFFGWVVDLSSKDPLYVLPIAMGASMIWQQHLSPTGDGKQRVMMWFMSILLTVFFAKAPAGLVLYWLVNNLVTIGEDYLRKCFFNK